MTDISDPKLDDDLGPVVEPDPVVADPEMWGAKNPERYVEYMAVKDLVPARKNPKRHDIATLRRSVERFGYIEPVTIDERTGRLISGHGRTETLRDLEVVGGEPPDGVSVRENRWYIPVNRGWASTDDVEAEAAIVTVNRIGELGGWDDVVLDDILTDVAESSQGLDGVGFEPPAEDLPSSRAEELTALRWSHVLLSYPVDLHGDVAKALEVLESNPQIRLRSTTNDSRG